MKQQLFTIAAVLSFAASGSMAQGVGGGGRGQGSAQANFQQAETMGGGRGIQIFPTGGRGGRGALVTGSPVSAREVNKTVQTLSDGTELENTHATLFYRDSQGRTRTEPADQGGQVVIVDPVEGVRIMLDPSGKTARRIKMPTLVPTATFSSNGASANAATVESLQAQLTALAGIQAARVASTTTVPVNAEDLGAQMQNGVMAQGTRTTLTIPKGQIGNNRDIHVVNERWYSKELQMLVKSVNSDPRFGVTTYDLTNIVRSVDPSMFQIPASYTITDGPGRGGRGGAVK
jgi:hypothetical protein